MKKMTMIIYAASMLFSMNTMASEVCEQRPGMLHCGKGTIDSIHQMGSVELDGTTISGLLWVLGNLNAEHAELHETTIRGETHLNHSSINRKLNITGNLYARDADIGNTAEITGNFYSSHTQVKADTEITGTLDANDSTFSGMLHLTGILNADHSNFLAPITLNANSITFRNSVAGDITVRKSREDREQIIRLQNGTVTGNIRFESQKGIVVLDSRSKINGTVQGGKIVAGNG